MDGDFWGVNPLGEDRLALFIADFSEKGTAAAAKSIWLAGALANLADRMTDPSQCMAFLNDRLSHILSNGQYATLLLGVVDLVQNKFTYASSGAPLPVIVSPSGVQAVMAKAGPTARRSQGIALRAAGNGF